MSTTRFFTANVAASGICDTVHGYRQDDASGQFPLERALNGDRRAVWKTSGIANVGVIVDLNGFPNFDFVALLGIRTTGAGTLTQCNVDFSIDAATWFSSRTIPLTGKRDAGVYITPPPFLPGYIRLGFVNSASPFTVGRIFAGLMVDTGMVHSPGGEDTPVQNRLEQTLADGSFNLNVLGDEGRNIVLPFNSLTGTKRDQLRAIAAHPGSVVLWDTDDTVLECVVRGGAVRTMRRFVNTYDCSLELARLP